MWYGFDNEGACRFSSDGTVQPEPGISVVKSDVVYPDISRLVLIDGKIVEMEETANEANDIPTR
nr:MAG TPA: protein of unknown function DUF1868 [Caudoviricetes sp.]